MHSHFLYITLFVCVGKVLILLDIVKSLFVSLYSISLFVSRPRAAAQCAFARGYYASAFQADL